MLYVDTHVIIYIWVEKLRLRGIPAKQIWGDISKICNMGFLVNSIMGAVGNWLNYLKPRLEQWVVDTLHVYLREHNYLHRHSAKRREKNWGRRYEHKHNDFINTLDNPNTDLNQIRFDLDFHSETADDFMSDTDLSDMEEMPGLNLTGLAEMDGFSTE